MSETTTVPLGQLHRNDYNPRFARERHGGSVDIDIDSLAESISEHGLASPLSVRETPQGYEVIAGERRYLALAETRDDDYHVPVTVHDLDREGAMQLAFEENEEREDLSTMDEAWYFAERVSVDVDGESMSYAEYISNLAEHVPPSGLQVPHETTIERQNVSSDRLKAGTISERLSYLFLPAKAQEWIDEGELTKRATREITRRCRSNIDDPRDALDMMADLAETYGPQFGTMKNGDYDDLVTDIETRIDDYHRRKEVAEEEVEGFRDLVFERLDTLDEHLDDAAEQFDASYPVPEIPADVESPRDINFKEILSGVEEYRDELKAQRQSIIEGRRELDAEIDDIEGENARIKQAIRHYDEDDEQCVYCLQPLDDDRLRDVLDENRRRIDRLREKQDAESDRVSALHDAHTQLHRDIERINGARESYEEAYETAREFGEVSADD